MSQDEKCAMLSERAIAFSVESLLGIRDETLKDYNQKTSTNSSPALLEKDQKSKKQKTVTETRIEMELVSSELWSRFHELQNEMIITKNGRRIFPTLKVFVTGLDPESEYIMWIDIVPVDQLRYRYIYHSSRWTVAGSGESPYSNPAYIHPDSPSPGRYWMSHAVTFDKLKLTNSKEPKSKGQISLHSMHKYQPRIHIQKVADINRNPLPRVSSSDSLTFTFPETQFVTVTAYQNQQITHLKIACNPFAKGFREVTRNSQRKLGSEFLSCQNSLVPLQSQNAVEHMCGYRGTDGLSSDISVMENKRLLHFPLPLSHCMNFTDHTQQLAGFETEEDSLRILENHPFTVHQPCILYTKPKSIHPELRMKSCVKRVHKMPCENSLLQLKPLSNWRDPIGNRQSAFGLPIATRKIPCVSDKYATKDGFLHHWTQNDYL